MLFVDDTVIKFCQFCLVPTLSSTYKVTRDALQFVDTLAATLGTYGQFGLGILVTAVHTAVAIVIHRAVAYVVLVHQIDNIHNRLRVVCRIAINLDVEDVTTASEVVIGSLNLGLVLG